MKIREVLTPILALRGLRFSSKAAARQALHLYAEQDLDWTDAFVAAQMMAMGRREMYSYDRDFDQVAAIDRLEP